MAKQLIFNEEAREYFKRDTDILANAVKVTLGPRGRNVVLDKKWGSPTSTHDGVTVAKEIEIEDHFANMGVSLIKESAKKTSDDVGDGTTTATVLAQAMIRQGFKNIAAGADAMALKRGLEKATALLLDTNLSPRLGKDSVSTAGQLTCKTYARRMASGGANWG